MNYKAIVIGVGIAVFGTTDSNAQTTWADDIIVEGNMDIGTTADKGNLTVTGQTGNAASPGIRVTGDGGVLFAGTLGTGQIPTTGAGTRFMWYPKKAALRVGSLTSAYATAWDDLAIGSNSFALSDASATAEYSVALAKGYAAGVASIAIGGYAFGSNSAAIGGGSAFSTNSAAVGGASWADGISSFAAAGGETAGTYSTASSLGFASGFAAVALAGGISTGNYSAAIANGRSLGTGSVAITGTASGVSSFAVGWGTDAQSYGSIVIGRGNVREGSATSWVATDPLFVVGNGSGESEDAPDVAYSNAFVIYKNGNVKVSKRQGDILMGEFGNPE